VDCTGSGMQHAEVDECSSVSSSSNIFAISIAVGKTLQRAGIFRLTEIINFSDKSLKCIDLLLSPNTNTYFGFVLHFRPKVHNPAAEIIQVCKQCEKKRVITTVPENRRSSNAEVGMDDSKERQNRFSGKKT
jgi:hypothetical protein